MEKDNYFNLFNDLIIEEFPEAFDEEIEEKPVKTEKFGSYLPRTHGERVNYQETSWFRWINDPLIEIPSSKVSKLFQLRFRIPYLLFKHYFVPRCKFHNIFDSKRNCINRCPIELKIMACLRILGRGITYDDINEMSQVPNSSVPTFLHTFVKNVTERMYNEAILEPANTNLKSRMITMLLWVIQDAWGPLIALVYYGLDVQKPFVILLQGRRRHQLFHFWLFVITTVR
jgi:hypothetical protein